MTSNTLPPTETPARLGELLVEAWQMVRTLQREYRAAAELLQHALDLIREGDQERDQLRNQNQALRDELLRYTAQQVGEGRAA